MSFDRNAGPSIDARFADSQPISRSLDVCSTLSRRLNQVRTSHASTALPEHPLTPHVLVVFALISVESMLSLFRFDKKFGEVIVYPLVALFFGTGNQTPFISSAILERVFKDPSMRLVRPFPAPPRFTPLMTPIVSSSTPPSHSSLPSPPCVHSLVSRSSTRHGHPSLSPRGTSRSRLHMRS